MAKVSGSNLYPQTATNVHDLSVWRNDFSMPTLSPTSSVVDIRANRDAALDNFSVSISSFLLYFYKAVFIATQLNSTQLNWTQQPVYDVINKNTTELVHADWLYAVQLGQLSWVEFSSVELSCVAINGPLDVKWAVGKDRCMMQLDEDSPIGYYKTYYKSSLFLLPCITLSLLVNCLPADAEIKLLKRCRILRLVSVRRSSLDDVAKSRQ